MVKGGLLGASMLLGVTACTDDHFDISTGAVSSTSTIWENIEANSELDSVAMILSRIKVLRTETDYGANKQTYAELLNQPQVFTAWLPIDGSFNAKYYLDKLDEAEEVYNDSAAAGTLLFYDLQTQFAQNHLSRFNYESNTGEFQVRLMNTKLCNYDKSNGTFNGVSLNSTYTSIPSSNGVLHVLDGLSEYAYNIYDYWENDSTLSDFYNVVAAYDTYTFSSSSSTEGTMNEEGQMVYIDSVFAYSNDLLTEAQADITNEDSLFVAVLPTNAAYAQAKETVSSLYKYASSYAYEWSSSSDDFEYTGTNALRFDTDSLQELNTNQAILNAAFVSATSITGLTASSDSATFVGAVMSADSLITPARTIIYNKNTGGVNPIFDGKTPEKASNGYVFTVDNYNYDPAYSFISKSEIDASERNVASLRNSTTASGTPVQLTSDNWNTEVELGGLLDDNTYYYFPVSGSSTMTIKFRLDDVLSGKYKVSIVMLPNRVNINNIRTDSDGEEIEETSTFDAKIIDDKGNDIASTVSNSVNQTAVERIVLWDSVEFPYCYASLPDGYESFPILRLQLTRTQQTRGNSKALSIAKIILEPVRE